MNTKDLEFNKVYESDHYVIRLIAKGFKSDESPYMTVRYVIKSNLNRLKTCDLNTETGIDWHEVPKIRALLRYWELSK